MNTEVTNAPLVLPERLSAVEVGQGVFLSPPSTTWKDNPCGLQRAGSLLVSTGGSILVSANALDHSDSWLLSPAGTGPHELKTGEKPSGDPLETFRRHFTRSRRILEESKDFGDELRGALCLDHPVPTNYDADVVDIFLTIGLNDFLLRVHGFLEGKQSYTHIDRLSRLLDELMPAGLDPGWVEAVQKKLAGKGGLVSVPQLIEAFEAEITKAGVVGGSAHYERSSLDLPAGRDQVEFGGVEPPGPGLRDLHKEFRRSVLRKSKISESNPNALQKLKEQLKAYWKMRRPLFALTTGIDPAAMADFPWKYFLLFKPDDVATQFNFSRETAVYLQGIHDELRRLEKAN